MPPFWSSLTCLAGSSPGAGSENIGGVPSTVGEARDSTELVGDHSALRDEVQREGYVLVRGIVPPGVTSELRAALGRVLEAAGLAAVEDPHIRPAAPDVGVDVDADRGLFRALYTLEVLHALPHHPSLLALAGALLGADQSAEPLLVHPRPALRLVFPGTPGPVGATPCHQDHLAMQGTTEVYTIWVAIVPCSTATGVLALAAGSHRGGVRPYRSLAGSRVAGCDDSGLEDSWVTAELDPGDVLAFHSLMVHRALPNTSKLVRASVDARYQRASEPVCESTLSGLADLPWDELYAGWSEEGGGTRRYWERMDLRQVPFDASLFTPGATGGGR